MKKTIQTQRTSSLIDELEKRIEKLEQAQEAKTSPPLFLTFEEIKKLYITSKYLNPSTDDSIILNKRMSDNFRNQGIWLGDKNRRWRPVIKTDSAEQFVLIFEKI